MNIDLVVVWPQDFDYPLFRKLIRENREHFHRVIVVWSNMNTGRDVRKEVQEIMAKDDIAFMQAPQHTGEQDWRNVAINHALGYSSSEWLWFTEQDFSFYEPFWEVVTEYLKKSDLVGITDSGRIHPACLFIKRSVLNKTSLDFSADPGAEYDHFGKIQKELMNWKEPLVFSEIPRDLYHHMNGLTHNLYLKHARKKVTYKPKEFKKYLKEVKNYESN